MTVAPDVNVVQPGDDDFWRSVLGHGGVTIIPRWSRTPVPGVAEHEVTTPEDVLVAARRLSDDMSVPISSVLPAAHAKVPAAMSGEREVTTAYTARPGAWPLPCRLTTDGPSWQALVQETRWVEKGPRTHQRARVEDLERELGLPGPLSEASFVPFLAVRASSADPGRGLDPGRDLPVGTVLQVVFAGSDSGPVRRSRYRRNALDARCAARIAGHHLTAPTLMAARPSAPHGPQSLLSAEEIRFQLDGLDGPRRELAHRCVHALFEQRAQDHASIVAMVHGARQLTYTELDERADKRIATMLSRAGCRLALTQLGSTPTLSQAVAALAEVRTPGSTGEPEGAMCEHAGMLNHIHAKIGDLGIDDGRVVAQTAPQCFDISSRQPAAAPVADGRTLLVPQEVIGDIPRYIDIVTDGHVNIPQPVPSYLDAVLSLLEKRPRARSTRAPHIAAGPDTNDSARVGRHHRRHRALPARGHVTAPDRTS